MRLPDGVPDSLNTGDNVASVSDDGALVIPASADANAKLAKHHPEKVEVIRRIAHDLAQRAGISGFVQRMGVRHDPALREALSETSHCCKAPARRTAIQGAFLNLVAAVGAWIDQRSEQKMLARLDKRLLRDTGLTRSEHSETRVTPLTLAGTV